MISCPKSKRIEVVKHLIQELKPLMNMLEIQVVICALISALDWDSSYIRILFLESTANNYIDSEQRSPPKKNESKNDEDIDKAIDRYFNSSKNSRHKKKSVIIILFSVILGFSIMCICL